MTYTFYIDQIKKPPIEASNNAEAAKRFAAREFGADADIVNMRELIEYCLDNGYNIAIGRDNETV